MSSNISEISFSPREKISFEEDQAAAEAGELYLQQHQEIAILVNEIQTQILIQKPNNIIEFMCETFFTIENVKKWKDRLKRIG
jgi:hypothetical protein